MVFGYSNQFSPMVGLHNNFNWSDSFSLMGLPWSGSTAPPLAGMSNMWTSIQVTYQLGHAFHPFVPTTPAPTKVVPEKQTKDVHFQISSSKTKVNIVVE